MLNTGRVCSTPPSDNVVEKALKEDRTVKDVVITEGSPTEAEAAAVLDPAKLTERVIHGDDSPDHHVAFPCPAPARNV